MNLRKIFLYRLCDHQIFAAKRVLQFPLFLTLFFSCADLSAMEVTFCRMDDRNIRAVSYVGTRPTGGKVQFELLRLEGLQERDYVLEIGCGALMAGIPIMSFLEAGHYVGIDPNSWLMEQSLLIQTNREMVSIKKPLFLQNEEFDAQSTEIIFDYIFSHSVLSHAADWQLSLFLQNTAKVLKKGGKLIFSARLTEPNEYGNEGSPKETQAKEWEYPGCTFFDKETIFQQGAKWFRAVEHKKEYTAMITKHHRNVCHDWFVLTK